MGNTVRDDFQDILCDKSRRPKFDSNAATQNMGQAKQDGLYLHFYFEKIPMSVRIIYQKVFNDTKHSLARVRAPRERLNS